MTYRLTIAITILTLGSTVLAQCTSTATDLFGAQDTDDPNLDDAPSDSAIDVSEDVADADADEPGSDASTDAPSDTASDTSDLPSDQPWELRGSGTWADPFIVDRLPFTHQDDTRASSEDAVDSYSCAPDTDESGAEIVYRLVGIDASIIHARVDMTADSGSDADVHLLLQSDPETCAVRDHIELYGVIAAEDDPYVVVDTWVDGSGVEYPGAYELNIDRAPLPSGDCALVYGAIEMFNRDEPLRLPAIGEVVMEAHLVTTSEFPDVWPTSSRDGIENHYTITEAASGYVMERDQDWAPEGEGGSEWGQGSTSRPPPLDESWYVNMYWRNRPDRGTRMLVYNPATGRAVVTAAGYETGPGSSLRIGGACEEVHDHLGTDHRSKLLMAFLVDQTLPFGPIDCQ